ncbi:MAG TPA: DUF885 family protein, partial [Acidobacteriaceae bacterium]|nr:DUF885 family protein [Acidobacteriaceae bacterium]
VMSLRILRIVAVSSFMLAPGIAPAQSLPLAPQQGATAPADLASRTKALNDLFDEIWQDRLSHAPEFASAIGDKQWNDQLTDYSVATYNDEIAGDGDYLARLAAIDPTGMPDEEVLSKDLMVRQLIAAQEESQFKPWEMPVNQVKGLPIELPRLAERLSFTSAKDYDDYTARLNKAPAAFRQITDNMMLGVEDQRVPPKAIVQDVLDQVNALLKLRPEDSPFAQPLGKIPATIAAADQAQIRSEVLAAIRTQVYPAYQRFAKFVQAVYLPAGRSDAGVWSLRDGDAYYSFLVKQSTTMDLTPQEIHEIGAVEVARDEAAELTIAKQLGYTTVAALRAAIDGNPRLHATSADALVSLYRTDLDKMRQKLPELFTRLPQAPLAVEAMPENLEQGLGPAFYEERTPDGSRPGTLLVNTDDWQHRSLAGVEASAYDEGEPGHRLQISIAQELTGAPAFRKYESYTAYTEGWGLYADQLGKDAGFFQDPYSDFGRLEADELSAIELVADTGVHSESWTRQQMVDYFHAHSGLNDATVNAEVDRIIACPADALGAKLGELKIMELRRRAQAALGVKFDLRAFDDEIVDSGALPLDVLDARVTAWIGAQQAAK